MELERKGASLVIAACFLWGLDLVIRYSLTLRFSYLNIVFIESLLGLIFIMPWMIKNRAQLKSFTTKDWLLSAFIGGVGLTVAGFLVTIGIRSASPGVFSFFQLFQPLFVLYMAYLILKEKVDNLHFYWGMWAVLSAVLMFSQDLEFLFNGNDSIKVSDSVLALTTMLIWGLCTIAGKKLLQTHQPAAVGGVRGIFAFIFSSVFLLLSDAPFLHPGTMTNIDFLKFGFIGIISGTASMFLYYSGLKKIAASKVAFMELSYPAFGLVLSALYTYESMNFLQILGTASFFCSLLLLLSRKEKKYLQTVKP